MKKEILAIGTILIVVFLFLIFNFNESKINIEDNNIEENNLENEEAMMEDKDSSSYREFTKESYDKSLSENKKILLYFYANWCPTCIAEQPAIKEAFIELEDSNVIGFRVNYKDSETDSYEQELAKKFGIAYQHTKVLLVNGEPVLKSLETWNKERYIEELNNF